MDGGIKEQARDLQCEMAKEAELLACSKCEELELKSVCSIRLNADLIINLIQKDNPY